MIVHDPPGVPLAIAAWDFACYRIACIGARQLSAGNTTGMVFVYHPPMVGADLSFGGIRRSGYGGELPGPGGPLPGFWH